MFNIVEFWTENNIGEKVYFGYALIVLLIVLCYVFSYLKSNPKKKLKFIEEAQKDNRMAVAKMTCLTLHGDHGPDHYQAEYMYVVDGKRYFITYKMAFQLPMDDRKDRMNADMVLLNLKPALILFYDKKNPAKAISKIEVFTSSLGIYKIPTPKNNIWRDTEKEWTQAIDLHVN